MTAALTVKDLAQIAAVLDSPEFADSVSPAQRRAFRNTADTLTEHFAAVGGVTAAVVLAMLAGAHLEATASQATNPVSSLLSGLGLPGLPGAAATPNTAGMVVIAYLARDVLAGERVS